VTVCDVLQETRRSDSVEIVALYDWALFCAYRVTVNDTFHHSLVFSLEGRAWQEPEPSHVTGMALAHSILGKFLGVVCHCLPRL